MIKESYIYVLKKLLANQSVMFNEKFGNFANLPTLDPGNKFTINDLIDLIFVNFLIGNTLRTIITELYAKLVDFPVDPVNHILGKIPYTTINQS